LRPARSACPKFKRAPFKWGIHGAIRGGTRRGTTIKGLYTDPKDEALHQRAIARLARKLNRPIAPVKDVYEAEYARLKVDAKVTGFLGVIASRRARDVLLRTPT
jgi:hypothetical protein